MNVFMMLVALLGGIATGVQAGVNALLGRKIGTIEGAFVSFMVGTVALFLLMLFFGKGNLGQMFNLPRWQLTGGLLGSFFVLIMVMAVPKIGVATTLIAVISGQLLASTVIDHFGLLGGRQIPIDWQRGLGLVLLAAAMFLFYRK
jgi:transporter family-2 protein